MFPVRQGVPSQRRASKRRWRVRAPISKPYPGRWTHRSTAPLVELGTLEAPIGGSLVDDVRTREALGVGVWFGHAPLPGRVGVTKVHVWWELSGMLLRKPSRGTPRPREQGSTRKEYLRSRNRDSRMQINFELRTVLN